MGGGMKKATLIALTVFALGAGVAQAQSLNDPMRPPQFTGSEAVAAKTGPVLQSVIISKTRRYAIISGERIGLGGAYGEAKLVRIGVNEVTLRDAAGETVLKLVPEIKTPSVAPKLVSRAEDRGER